MTFEVIEEGPREITEDNVIFWSSHAKELKGSMVNKAQVFLKHKCIQYLGNNTFVCLPLNKQDNFLGLQKVPFTHDYNSSYYLIRKVDGEFQCSCQGWWTKKSRGEGRKDGCNCSHVLSLFLSFKLKRFNGLS